MKKNEDPVVIEEFFETGAEKLWKAITVKEKMIKWFFPNIPEFEPVVGFEIKFDVDTGERIFPHNWKIKEVIKNRLISYFWSYDNYEGLAVVNFELEEKDNATLLKLYFEILEDFDDLVPEFRRESCIDGWNYFINRNLKNYINSV